MSNTVPFRKQDVERVVDASSGGLSVRLAENEEEISASQSLRYRVFYEEMAAKPTPEMAARKQDFDDFDAICDHLLVFDAARGEGAGAVVGTYRLLRRAVALKHRGFYTAGEYDIGVLQAYPGEILELGRSCVDANYRSRAGMQLLWRGIAQYVFHHKIEIMFGCASLPGTDPARIATSLAYLYHYHLAPPALRPRALPERYTDMRLKERQEIDPKKAQAALPPLIKGYLRLGGFIGDGAVVDEQFNTTDVCVIVKTDWVTDKYSRHYAREEGRESGLLD